MLDLHRHTEFSTFDGFGKAQELAELAKSLGHTSLSISDHGNMNGVVKHYNACKKGEINCVIGVEAYFQPTWNKEKPRYHLCLFAKNLKGYENLNKLMYIGEQQKYYNPIVTFEDLEKHSEGVICTTACVQGYLPKAVLAGKPKLAEKILERFVSIFGDDFYIEIQPYSIDKEGTQETVNRRLMQLADKWEVKCVLTSDSHYGSKEDFDTYLKMHEIAKSGYDIVATYGERYMPTEKELLKRFYEMHRDKSVEGVDFKCMKKAKQMVKNLEEIESKVEQNILDELEEELPKVGGGDSYKKMMKIIRESVSDAKKHNNWKYYSPSELRERCKEELKIIKMHGFADYFLIVADYVQFARDNDIQIGPGRGSVCNCQIAFELGITTVDSLRFGLVFQRFLRDDKKKLPDIDLDFETSRRQEVIDYLIDKYRGHSAQICSYGLYKVDNLVNDLVKVCGLEDKGEIKRLKSYLNTKIDDTYHFEYCPDDHDVKYFNSMYDDIVKHFSKLYGKVRFIGTHAAGVAITGGDITKYCAIRVAKDKNADVQREYTAFDLADLEDIKVVKFDMLGLTTMESLGELRRLTEHEEGLPDSAYEDEAIWEMFSAGETDGVFQFEKGTPKRILQDVNADCFEDICAISSMNRPGPLSMKMPEQYAHNKFNLQDVKGSRYYEFTKDTYGTIVYQEQLQQIVTQVGLLTWADADRLMKLMKQAIATMGDLDEVAKEREDMIERFVAGALSNGWGEAEAKETAKGMMAYLFNKGHSVGYSQISLEEMFYKVHYPTEFWYTKLKYAKKNDEAKLATYREKAVAGGAVIFLPHVNYTADYSLRKVDGEFVIQEGYVSIKDVGEKAASIIQDARRKGPFLNFDDFYDRCKSRAVTSRVIDRLMVEGALEFNKAIYVKRVTKYNAALYTRGVSKGGTESERGHVKYKKRVDGIK